MLRLLIWMGVAFCLSTSAGWAERALDGLQIGTGTEVTVVLLHGDEGTGGDPSRSFAFGAEIARRLPGVTVHALLRPGYSDPWGRKSPGDNYGRRDQYTMEAAAIIAGTLRGLRTGAPVIAIGHSGGAAQLALALSLEDNLVDEAILIGCPCDLELWRQLNPQWPPGILERSVSAMDVRPKAVDYVTLVVGEADRVTPLALSQSYALHLQDSGVSHRLIRVPGGDHSGNRALSRAWLTAIFEARLRLLGK